MKFSTVILIFIIGIIGGCVTIEPRAIVLPNGHLGFVVDCTHTQWSDCFVSASISCPSGYKIFERTMDKYIETTIPLTEMVNEKPALRNPSAGFAAIGRLNLKDKYMVITCRV